MSSEEIEDILQGVQVGDVKDFDAHILRAVFANVTARAEAAERDAEAWRGFAIDVAREVAPVGAEDSAHQTSVGDLPALLKMVRGAGEQHAMAIARAEAAEAAAAAAGPITVCDCGVGGPRLCDEDGLCVNCGCDVVVVADQHSADIVAQLRQEREAAEAALATARAEGAAADALLSDGLEIVESLSGGYDVWCDAVRRRLTGGPVEGA
jgi:hypothetical protein